MSNFNITPVAYREKQEVIRITNRLARKGFFIDTEKRNSDWIAFVHDTPEKWDRGHTELEAIQKLEISLMARI